MGAVIVISSIFSIIALVVFFVLASNVGQIKKYLEVIAIEYEKKRLIDNSPIVDSVVSDLSSDPSQPEGLIVVELQTGRKMTLGERIYDGKYRCYYVGGGSAGILSESEFMEFDKWVRDVYRK